MVARRPLWMTLAAVIVCAVASLRVTGDEPEQQRPTFTSSARTVPIYATVTDAAGRLVPDLVKADFEVYDDGKKVEVSLFENAVQPITVVVMLDTSGSMTMNLELLKQAATQFVIRLLPDDRAKVGSFSDKIIVGPDEFTGDRDELMRILREDIQFGNPTALWDATDAGMDALDGTVGRRVVLVFTDGADTYSRKKQRDILDRARADEFMIYAIGLRSVMRGQGVSRPDPGLRKVAEETGGGYFELRRTDELNATFTRVASELHSQYVLGFTPQALDGKIHKLEVKITRPGLVSRARKSYVAK
ncbi:MAG: VWA domain-containing protein [Acidobacteria bacterium]|jgi:Ca-activated chloride channel homolog|nr:VWA domain-containing protein [Acidobacteriota bacterium]